MDELELVRLHEDGEHLVLRARGGAEFTLPITEALRAAVRRDRPHLEHLRAEGERNLAPREIQARLRAGESVEAVAEAAGLGVEHVRRFAGPVVAEQEYVVDRVRASRQGHEEDSPTVGELVAQRLAARDVEPDAVEWSAARQPGASWVVTAAFEVGTGSRTARWEYDAATRALQALDDEARWLSGTDAPRDPTPGAVAVFDVDATGRGRGLRAAPPTPPDDGTAELLDDLSQRRGVRPRKAPAGPVEVEGQEPFEGFGPQVGARHDEDASQDAPDDTAAPAGATVVHLPTVRPLDAVRLPDPVPDDAPDDPSSGPQDGAGGPPPREERSGGTVSVDADEPQRAARPQTAREPRKGKNRSRATVPSWDEIVFGARPE
ncbi:MULTISPECIES: septation protein SepH [Cellulosimicrobium]|uniref:Septation protein SepH n=1 Tax=Cellulosimicrobium sp. ES-005 TaxID=3163031 RepID=A0AAU8G555_9MICO|nr:septation protein SepH [Cellulosimicrobium cellulans]MCO7271595.1 septation protein SepH [Cellulosimicrobium cellulans]